MWIRILIITPTVFTGIGGPPTVDQDMRNAAARNVNGKDDNENVKTAAKRAMKQHTKIMNMKVVHEIGAI